MLSFNSFDSWLSWLWYSVVILLPWKLTELTIALSVVSFWFVCVRILISSNSASHELVITKMERLHDYS